MSAWKVDAFPREVPRGHTRLLKGPGKKRSLSINSRRKSLMRIIQPALFCEPKDSLFPHGFFKKYQETGGCGKVIFG